METRLGKINYERRQYAQAVHHLQLALKQNPDDGEATQLLGLSDYLMGRAQQAIPLLQKVQSWLPHPDVTGSYVLGVSYLSTQQFDKARIAFATMFGLPPASPEAHLALAQMMLHNGFDPQAVPELTKALALDPRLPMAHFLLGEIYLIHSKPRAALDEFRQELVHDPILSLAYWRMGDAYFRLEQWDEAEQVLKQALWLNQNFTGPYLLLGKVELKKGLPGLAAEFLERAIKLDPNDFSAHYLLGTALRQLGRKSEADREFALSQSLLKDQP